MCHKLTNRQTLAHAADQLTQIHHDLRRYPVDLPPILPQLDSVIDRLGVAERALESGNLRVHHAAQAAFLMATQAYQLLFHGHNRAADWVEVATSMVLIAKHEALEAIWASEDSDWLSDIVSGRGATIEQRGVGHYVAVPKRCSLGYGKEGR